MIQIGNEQMNFCRGCGCAFAVHHHAELYCSDPDCQALKARRSRHRKPYVPRTAQKEKIARGESPWAGVRAAENDAKAALEELRAWLMEARKDL